KEQRSFAPSVGDACQSANAVERSCLSNNRTTKSISEPLLQSSRINPGYWKHVFQTETLRPEIADQFSKYRHRAARRNGVRTKAGGCCKVYLVLSEPDFGLQETLDRVWSADQAADHRRHPVVREVVQSLQDSNERQGRVDGDHRKGGGVHRRIGNCLACDFDLWRCHRLSSSGRVSGAIFGGPHRKETRECRLGGTGVAGQDRS